MSLNAALSLFLDEYPKAMRRPFSGDAVAEFIRHEVPAILEAQIANPRYLVVGSAGQGNWARVPWVAVFDSLVTESAQSGFYIVYLVKEDFSGVYLSLNQGVTTARELYGSEAKHALRVRADDFVARLGKVPDAFEAGPIDLAVGVASSLGAFYEAGAICSRYYSKSELPDDAHLLSDLSKLLAAYLVLSAKELPPSSAIVREDDEVEFEDPTKIRTHKRIERNQRLAKKVKAKKGYTCEACGFAYAQNYHGLKVDYIEAHHLVPLAELSGSKVPLDPLKDFAVLCANCHRMIHRSEYIHDVSAFREAHVKTQT